MCWDGFDKRKAPDGSLMVPPAGVTGVTGVTGVMGSRGSDSVRVTEGGAGLSLSAPSGCCFFLTTGRPDVRRHRSIFPNMFIYKPILKWGEKQTVYCF